MQNIFTKIICLLRAKQAEMYKNSMKMIVRIDEKIVQETCAIYPAKKFSEILKMALRTYKLILDKQNKGYDLFLEKENSEKIKVNIT